MWISLASAASSLRKTLNFEYCNPVKYYQVHLGTQELLFYGSHYLQKYGKMEARMASSFAFISHLHLAFWMHLSNNFSHCALANFLSKRDSLMTSLCYGLRESILFDWILQFFRTTFPLSIFTLRFPFPDILIHLQDGHIRTCLYRKPTNHHSHSLFIVFVCQQLHPLNVFKGFLSLSVGNQGVFAYKSVTLSLYFYSFKGAFNIEAMKSNQESFQEGWQTIQGSSASILPEKSEYFHPIGWYLRSKVFRETAPPFPPPPMHLILPIGNMPRCRWFLSDILRIQKGREFFGWPRGNHQFEHPKLLTLHMYSIICSRCSLAYMNGFHIPTPLQ